MQTNSFLFAVELSPTWPPLFLPIAYTLPSFLATVILSNDADTSNISSIKSPFSLYFRSIGSITESLLPFANCEYPL